MSQLDNACKLVDSNGVSILTLKGKVKITEATCLKELLIEAVNEGNPIRVDMSELEDIDITMIQLLFSARNKAATFDLEFNIFPISVQTKELLRTSGVLYELFNPNNV
ncbi:MAG: STAS domain-containing protein [Colwellia sp.]|nr:STAS domain-containing protein [Colwellia sp.]